MKRTWVIIAALIIAVPALASQDYLIVSRSELAALPTAGAAWDALVSRANAAGTPDLCDQDNKVGTIALAAGLVYARTADAPLRAKAQGLIEQAIPTQRDGCSNAVLSMGRQIGAYVLAADLIGYRDAAWLAWLSDIRMRTLGGHGRWTNLDYTCGDSSNNWGAFACGALTTIDAYLGRDLSTQWARFRGFTGDRAAYIYRTPSVHASWVCPGDWTPIQVCPGDPRDGAPAEDAHRSGAYPTISKTYVQETMQGLALNAEVLARKGYPAWDRLRSLSDFATRWTVWNASSVGYHLPRWFNARLGAGAPEQAAGYGRTFGFTDWLYPGVAPTPTPSVTPAPSPTATATPAPTPSATPNPTCRPHPRHPDKCRGQP